MNLQEKFKMKDLGEPKFFLGIEFSKSKRGIHMCQRKYALELVSEPGISSSKLTSTPMKFNHKLTSVEFDKIVKVSNENDPQLVDKGGYQIIIGKLFYLTMTRPDLAFTVQVLSQYMHATK